MEKIKGGKDREEVKPDKKNMLVTTDANKNIVQIAIPGEPGEDDLIVKFTNVEGKPNPDAILPAEVCEALELFQIYRQIGDALEKKIPLYEAAANLMDKFPDETKRYPLTEPRIYITKVDLMHNKDLIKEKLWCLYIEKEIEGKLIKAGAYIAEEYITDIALVKSQIQALIKRMGEKFGN